MSEVSHQQATETKVEQQGHNSGKPSERTALSLSGFTDNTNPSKVTNPFGSKIQANFALFIFGKLEPAFTWL